VAISSVNLKPHPETPAGAVRDIEVVVNRVGAALSLGFAATGDLSRLRVPAWVKPSRADELWRTTCFEAFLQGEGDSYVELNLSPSGQWAAYGFEGYRRGMRPLDGIERRDVRRTLTAGLLEHAVTLDLDRLPPGRGTWRLALSAVIEDVDGAISYWALNHPSNKPDFHHPDSFVLDLP